MYALGAVGFFLALLISVTLHEAGHFLTARRFGMKATQFFVGFGPTIWSTQRGETEYGVKAVPLGGFVKIVGQTPLDEIEPGDEGRAFFRFPTWQKFVVLVAGSTMHFIIAIALLFITIATIGVSDPNAPVIGKPVSCVLEKYTQAQLDDKSVVLTSKPNADGSCPAGNLPGVAKAAGIQPGDRVVAVDGTPIATYKDFAKYIRANTEKQIKVRVERDGAQVTIPITPITTSRPDIDDPSKQVEVGTIGIVQSATQIKDVSFVDSFGETGTQLGTMVTATYKTLVHKLGTIGGVYGDNRDPEGFIGLVGAGRISGEIINLPEPFDFKLLNFLFVIASLNLFVGVFNLLPLLPLDGGHIAVAWFEGIRDRVKRARGYVGEVVRVDYNKLMPLTMAVVALFVGFTVWILGADIVNPVRING